MKILGLPPNDITEQVKSGKVTICIVGLGYVGLPLATLFALEGAEVIGCDKRTEVVRKVMSGETTIQEHDVTSILRKGGEMLKVNCPNCGVKLINYSGQVFCPSCGRAAEVGESKVRLLVGISSVYSELSSQRMLISEALRNAVESGRLKATTDTVEAVSKSDVIMICVGTPLGEDFRPNYSDLINACSEIGRGLEGGDLVILKSTVSPGTTENIVGPLLEKESRLKLGVDFGLANSPERVKEGYALFEFRTVPRNVAGVDKASGEAAAAVFRVFPAEVYVFDSPRVTEAAKLFENIYRDVNIALANELALVSEKLQLDVMKVIEAARTDPKTNLLLPGPGVGGYCLPKDPYYLATPARDAGLEPRLILLSRSINDSMPLHVLTLVREAFTEMGEDVGGRIVSVLGLAFKGNSGDLRNTPMKPVLKGLSEMGARIKAHDPYVDFQEAEKVFSGLNVSFTRSVLECITGASCLIIGADHLDYRRLTASEISRAMAKPAAVVDARRVFDPESMIREGLIYRGVGYGLAKNRGSSSDK
ncbi:MAG: nucleotide sugar dehydrogenase [Candidatus Brockarchaeota archaeon]|nr:nucleotide sugar dehydrogenase [Candidatus Brockarchaeota archaeon]